PTSTFISFSTDATLQAMKDIAPLVEKGIDQYKKKVLRICLECPHYPDNCPPRRCPVYLGVKIPTCSTRNTLLNMIKGYK
ncbi:MAG TPA: hypothetical protein PKM87_09565, partial [Methanolinea sp.]|nr:hypothetical protein [Methanolinea sp.]